MFWYSIKKFLTKKNRKEEYAMYFDIIDKIDNANISNEELERIKQDLEERIFSESE